MSVKSSSFPMTYPPTIKVDAMGTTIEDNGKHQWSQGWLQTLSFVSKILEGTWGSTTITAKDMSVSNCIITPYNLSIFMQSAGGTDQVLTLPGKYTGILSILDGSTMTYLVVNGSEIALPALSTGTVISAQLQPI